MVLGGLSGSLADVLVRGGIFILVQALVYVILSNSSDIFSTQMRSVKFKPARLAGMTGILASLSDLPLGRELLPLSENLGSPRGCNSKGELKN